MSLTPGTRLGPYEIVAPIGAGGMGEVYRAKDTNLNRDVALKILPESFALDADRVARFKREAQVLASLNHPNIAHIHGVEEANGVRALVMELVDGEDLSVIIARGAVPLEDALPIAKQIADALEAAHEAGVIHRDLKPANIKVRKDGTVKVLDFGLAKAIDPSDPSGAMNSPTMTARATQLGMILGTAAYMSPEQAKGRVVDRRADIWAFGVVLYEMLTGRRAFEGDDITEVLASVLKTDPVWTSIPQNTPPSVRRLLRRCLEKDPRKRLSSIGDARLELDEIEPPTTAATMSMVGAARPSLVSRLWPLAAGIVLAAGVAALMWPASTPAANGLARLSVIAPPGSELYPDSANVAISPDGTMVAFITGTLPLSENQLWVRSIDGLSSRRLDDAEHARLPFWSPDSRRIGFFTSGKLKTIAVTGGRAEVLADSPNARGGAWSPSNVIIYAPEAGGPLYRIAASSGKPEPVTTLDAARHEYGHRFPFFLPDGKHFLYAALPGKSGQFDIYAGSLDDHSKTFIGSMDGAPVYAEPGWLLYARQGVLAAQAFDATTLKLSGDPIPIGDEPTSILDPAISFTAGNTTSVSRSGSLAYFTTPSVNTRPTWFDARGLNIGPLNVAPGHYESATISPDGTQAILVRSTSPSEAALWLVDLDRGGASPLSTGHGRNDAPVWSADGRSVVFASDRDGLQDIYQKTIGDVALETAIYRSPMPFKNPTAWSRDGQWLVINQLDQNTAQNLWLIQKSGGASKPLVTGPTRESGTALSPDGQWFAYASDVTGRFEVYMDSFPTPSHRVRVSQEGGFVGGWWTRDQKQFLYLSDHLNSLWRVDVQAGAALSVGTARKVADLPPGIAAMDATPDRQRFLAIMPEKSSTDSITIVQNWKAALTKK